MTHQPEDTYQELERDLSHEWIDLSTKVRELAGSLKSRSKGTPLADDAARLEQDTAKLCDHLERIHRDVENLLIELDEKLPEMDEIPPSVDPAEVRREAIQIQRETHELRADFKDILKALFMWQDHPEERLRKKK